MNKCVGIPTPPAPVKACRAQLVQFFDYVAEGNTTGTCEKFCDTISRAIHSNVVERWLEEQGSRIYRPKRSSRDLVDLDVRFPGGIGVWQQDRVWFVD